MIYNDDERFFIWATSRLVALLDTSYFVTVCLFCERFLPETYGKNTWLRQRCEDARARMSTINDLWDAFKLKKSVREKILRHEDKGRKESDTSNCDI